MKIFAGDIVQKKKPAPDVYLLAANELGVNPRFIYCAVFCTELTQSVLAQY